MQSFKFIVNDPVGFHARPVSKLVQEAMQFESDITLKYLDTSVNLKSIFSVLALAIPTLSNIEISANGIDEETAIIHLKKISESL
jgi:phosphotransferase system HPr (HPr) family protein